MGLNKEPKLGALMTTYRQGSMWNDEMELRCLAIFKTLEEEKFPRGRQSELCRELSVISGLDVGNLSAKVSNYSSVAGVNGHSNASSNTIEIYGRYRRMTSAELRSLIESGTFKERSGKNEVSSGQP